MNMNPNDLKRMYGSTPERFQRRIHQALLTQPEAKPIPARSTWRTALITALVLALTIAVAAAAFTSKVADVYGWSYGENKRDELLAGKIAQEACSVQVGDAIYTLEEVTYIDDGLYGVGSIRPAHEGIILMAEDYQVTDAAGYSLYYSDSVDPPADAPSYADLASSRHAKILMVHCLPEAIGVDGGTMITPPTFGYFAIPQMDGSILFGFEIPTGAAVEDGAEYTISLWASNWEITPEGEWLRDEPNDTYTGDTWDAVVYPKPAKEME